MTISSVEEDDWEKILKAVLAGNRDGLDYNLLRRLFSHPMVQTILPFLRLQVVKERAYGNSWKKRGDVGVLYTVARKWDRMEQIITNAMQKGEVTEKGNINLKKSTGDYETFLDTIGDMGNYMFLWVEWFAERYPEERQKMIMKIMEMK